MLNLFLLPISYLPQEYLFQQFCEINMCIEYKTNYTEEIISRLKKQKWLIYKSWCNMQEPCKPNAYDCSWLIDAARRSMWYYNGRKINALAVYQAGKKIKASEVQRWDYMFMQNLEGWPNHLAIVSQPWNWKWVYVIDTVEYRHKVSERFIFIWLSQKYKIHFVRIDYEKKMIMNKITKKYYQE
jgi:hypothetical protein